MAKTNAERQRERWERLRAAVAERDQLRAQVGILTTEIERLEDELGAALEPGRAPRCPIHGCELACPQCHREGGWDSA